MPRPLRPVDDRLVYHAINRGNNRDPVFFHHDDYAAFLKALADLKTRRPFELYGYCLMPNHVHLLIRPLAVTISRLMQSLLVSHTRRYHRCHHSGGHVWQGRFKSPVVQDDDHLLTVLRYVEANPLRAGTDADRQRLWSAFVHQAPPDEELTALRRSTQTGLPYGEPAWVEQLGARLGLDLTARPRGRPRKAPQTAPDDGGVSSVR